MKKLRTTLTAGLLSVGLIAGMNGLASAAPGSIDTTGPDSSNHISSTVRSNMRIRNNNHVSVYNHNSQQANTGNATTNHNTRAGSARTGNASNATTLNASMTVDNSHAGTNNIMPVSTSSNNLGGSISDTGPDSANSVRSSVVNNVNVTNDNDLHVSNENWQEASSGDATVTDNTTGGSATSGNASNTSSTTLNFRVTN